MDSEELKEIPGTSESRLEYTRAGDGELESDVKLVSIPPEASEKSFTRKTSHKSTKRINSYTFHI